MAIIQSGQVGAIVSCSAGKIMKLQRTYEEWVSITIGVVIGLFCLFPKSISIGLVVLFLVVLYGWIKKRIAFQFTWFTAVFALLYITYAIGCSYTRHWDWASTYLENKVSFLVMPLLFCFRLKKPMKLQPIAWALIAANVLLMIIGVVNAYSIYRVSGDIIGSFTSSAISPIHHPTYFAAFNMFTLILVWWGRSKKWHYFGTRNTLLFFFFSAMVQIVCASLAGILFFNVMVFFVLIRWIGRRFGKKIMAGVIGLLVALQVSLVLMLPRIGNDIQYTLNVMKKFGENPYHYVQTHPDYKTGNEVRLIMWTVGISEWMQHPMGVGTGNVEENLNYRLYRSNQKTMVLSDYNPHNQFIQTAVEIGFIGLFFLLAIIFGGLRFAKQHRNWPLFLLLLNLAFNCMFESMFQRSSGIVFFTFLTCVLVVYSHSKATEVAEKEEASTSDFNKR
jgi:O-antigen ligase